MLPQPKSSARGAMQSTASKLDMSLDELARGGGLGKENGGGGNRRVFVGNLPYSCSWQDLKDHMRVCGEVLHCDIIAEPGTALGSKGCGIVEFAKAADAQASVIQMMDTEIQGRKIFVREDRESKSHSSSIERSGGKGGGKGGGGKSGGGKSGGGKSGGGKRVFVGNLPYSVSWQDLKDHIRQFGFEVVHCDILSEPGTALGSKGCGIVEFSSAADARRAIRELSDSVLKGRPIFAREDREDDNSDRRKSGKGDDPGRDSLRKPSFQASGRGNVGKKSHEPARRDRSRSRRGGGKGSAARLFVGNLAYSVTWQELKDHMRKAGDVKFCDIIKEPGTTLGSKGCAIVEYSSSAEARKAIRTLTDTELKGRKMFVREDRED